jgi:crotonobetainyl-CoA:carnitine CoA-transferase CaiB-like acyl-CoA transferase
MTDESSCVHFKTGSILFHASEKVRDLWIEKRNKEKLKTEIMQESARLAKLGNATEARRRMQEADIICGTVSNMEDALNELCLAFDNECVRLDCKENNT